jgi:protein-S-isoprenylcysteine O-methyltransferase Ste14
MTTNAYVSFLVVGVALVMLDGLIIYRSGRRYLQGSYGVPAAGASMTWLITVLFHLATLGVLALLSTVDIGGSDLPGVVGRLGVLLLVLAIAHAIALSVLSHIRGEQEAEAVIHRSHQRVEPEQQGTTVTPVPGQDGRYPDVSPSLERRAPYTTP